MVNGEKEESVGETPTGATETVALPWKSLMIGGTDDFPLLIGREIFRFKGKGAVGGGADRDMRGACAP